MNRILVFYDVQDDRLRTKIIDTCMDYGLDREQYSVFMGELTPRQMRALSRELDHLLQSPGYVLLIPVAASEWKKRVQIGAPLHVH
jgi:CRISPR-associated protein Cas2